MLSEDFNIFMWILHVFLLSADNHVSYKSGCGHGDLEEEGF